MIMLPQTNGFGESVRKALGLPERVVWFELRVAVDEAVTVKCAYRLDADPTKIVETISQFELVRRERSSEPTSVHFDGWLKARNDAAHTSMVHGYRELARMDERNG